MTSKKEKNKNKQVANTGNSQKVYFILTGNTVVCWLCCELSFFNNLLSSVEFEAKMQLCSKLLFQVIFWVRDCMPQLDNK